MENTSPNGHGVVTPGVMVRATNVRVRFGKMLAVKDVSFELSAGSLLGLIGPNGAGKTTLLRVLAGLQPVTKGHVEVMGEKMSVDALGRIGFTPDVPPVYENLTVRQFLTFIGKGYDLSREETDDRIAFWLEKVWLTDKAEQKIKGLSRGMKQRIGIARTLMANPMLVLLDEPAAGLDPAGRVQFRQLLVDLREQGRTLIVSSHILADMSDYCTHIGIMAAGELRQFGTVALVASGHDSGRCRYTVLLAHPVTGLPELLASIDSATSVQIERDRIVLEYGADKEAAAKLLAMLVAARVPVAGFTAMKADLEEAYLRAGIGQVD
jgi:ABC-2 type transport system ATP-binding protein